MSVLNFALGLLVWPCLGLASPSIDLLAVAEQTELGAKLPAPSPEHPVYYVAFDAGYVEAGDPVAGLEPPSPTAVGKALRTAFGAAGYAEATAQHAPSLVLVCHYGAIRLDSHATPPRISLRINPNLKARVELVATKESAQRAWDHILYEWDSNAGFIRPNVRDTLDYSRDARYFVIVSAYDYDDLTRQTPTLLWRMKLSAQEAGHDMATVIPALAGASGPYLGRNFKDRQLGVVRSAAAAEPGDSLAATPSPWLFPRKAVEKIEAGFMRRVLLQERAASSGYPPNAAGEPPAAPVVASPGAASAAAVDMLVVAEQTEQGAKLPPPSPERPIYYAAFDAGYVEAGDPIAGLKPPAPAAVGQALRAALGDAGYVEATAQQAPSLVLVYYYGSLRPGTNLMMPPRMSWETNTRTGLYLVTPEALAEQILNYKRKGRFAQLPQAMRTSWNYANGARYFLIVSAYDYADLTRRTFTLLWRAKLSALDTSGSMDEVVPALAGAGGPYLGRNFQDRQFGTAQPAPRQGPGAQPVPASPAFALPPEAAGKIDVGLRRDLRQGELAAMFGGDPAVLAEQASLPPKLARGIVAYQQEKDILQGALAAKLKLATNEPETRRVIDAFNTENADRLRQLERIREDLRTQLAQTATAGPHATDQSLDSLLREFAAGVQQLETAPATP